MRNALHGAAVVRAGHSRTNSNTSLFLVGAGISQQQFYKDRYLFRFGLTEDVPEGLLLRVNTGNENRNSSRPTVHRCGVLSWLAL